MNFDEFNKLNIADDKKVNKKFRTVRRMYKKLLEPDRAEIDFLLQFLTNEIYRRLYRTRRERAKIREERRMIEGEYLRQKQVG